MNFVAVHCTTGGRHITERRTVAFCENDILRNRDTQGTLHYENIMEDFIQNMQMKERHMTYREGGLE